MAPNFLNMEHIPHIAKREPVPTSVDGMKEMKLPKEFPAIGRIEVKGAFPEAGGQYVCHHANLSIIVVGGSGTFHCPTHRKKDQRKLPLAEHDVIDIEAGEAFSLEGVDLNILMVTPAGPNIRLQHYPRRIKKK